MSISIKTVFDGNIHRFYLAKPSYDELEQALNSIYGKRGFSIRYQDEDGDMISVSSSLELQEALRVANGGTLKLILSQSGADPSFVCVEPAKKTPPSTPVTATPPSTPVPAAVVHVAPEVKKEEVVPAAIPEAKTVAEPIPEKKPEPTVDVEEKKQAPPELSCDEMRVLACQFLSDPAVQLIFPDLAKAVLAKVVEEVRNKQDTEAAAKRVLEIITNHDVIKNHPAMASLYPHLGKVHQLLARVLGCMPPHFVEILDKVKDGFQPNVEMLMALLSNPLEMFSGGFDCGKFDLGSLGLSLPTLAPLLASLNNFSCGDFDFSFECKDNCKPSEGVPSHETVRCDGCGVFPIVGPRFNCTVCPDFDLCAKCEATAAHPPEHALIKYRQPANTAVVHQGVTCDGCQMSPITGVRFKCRVCSNYDLCESCEAKNVHPADHPLVKFKVEKMRHGGRNHWGHHGAQGHPLHKLFHEAIRGPFGMRGFGGPFGPRGFGGLGDLARGHGCHRRWLARGSVGDGVKEIQQALGIQADGFFGPKTEQAVKEFQTAHSLDADGVVGPRTRAKLLEKSAKPAAEAEKKPAEPVKEEKKPVDQPSWWARGAWGDAVKEIQQALGVQADGFFGPRTEQAVKEFQTLHNLIVDGIVGPRTRAALSSEKPAAPAAAALDQLAGMGFTDAALNARLLEKHRGDVDQVIAELLESA